eukprot:Hpha_TRINITY_DN7010_c0_g1::TRINITY_DN7010_c0_g1_i1::g.23000::m.23000
MGSEEVAYDTKFPPELRTVWNIAKELNPANPLYAFSPTLGPKLRLVGPFEVIAGTESPPAGGGHRLWRWWYDPPELLTIVVEEGEEELGARMDALVMPHGEAFPYPASAKGRRHWCYHRDDPRELPTFVACGVDGCYEYEVSGRSLVAVLHGLCAPHSPARKLLAAEGGEGGGGAAALRRKVSLSSTVSKLGLVVPYDKSSEVGYRELPFTNADLRKLVVAANEKKLTDAQKRDVAELSTFADIANDECDYGHGLELGLDLFCLAAPGTHLASEALRLMDMAYTLLGREGLHAAVYYTAERRRKGTGATGGAGEEGGGEKAAGGKGGAEGDGGGVLPPPPAAPPPAPAPVAAAAPAPAPAPVAAVPAPEVPAPTGAHKTPPSAEGPPPAKVPRLTPGGALRGCVVVLSGFKNPERGELRAAALKLGARCVDDWCPTATHLICAFPHTPKRKKAESSGHGWVVSKSWLLGSAAAGAREPESMHPV